jgi:hypothetical protein
VSSLVCFGEDQKAHMVPFENFVPLSWSVLFSIDMGDEGEDSSSSLPLATMSSSSSGSYDGNRDALEARNLVRKKFGLNPLTPEEYTDLQEKVAELDVQQQERAAAYAAEMAQKKKDEEPGFMKELFGKALESTCQVPSCGFPIHSSRGTRRQDSNVYLQKWRMSKARVLF